MKRSTFFFCQAVALGVAALYFTEYRLALACLANFSAGRWAEITK